VPEARRLVLLRHGRTAWNAEGRGQGHADVGLDEVGHAQARLAAPWLATTWTPSLLWSSDLARARETAAYVEEQTGLEAHVDPRLREFDLGERTGLTMPEFAERFPDEHEAWHRGAYGAVPGAESTADVHARLVPALRELLAATAPGATGLAVTHGASMRVGVAALLGWSEGVVRTLRGMGNCAVAVLVAEDAHDLERPLRLEAWNATPDFASSPAMG
jgi:broad specificity phosphatase PhoE